MKKSLLFTLCLFGMGSTFAQNTIKATIISEKTKEILFGASVSIPILNISTSTDSTGVVIITNIPDGKYSVTFSYTGFDSKSVSLTFPTARTTIKVELEPSDNELQEIVVQATRSSRTIKDIPTRVEVVSGEELDEKSSMKPGDIKMLLNESTGVATQQTSAVSGTANIRIQGLDGRYTQLLRDGMPLYQGFSGGLSVMQIAPLDLKQVEFIKGSASTLYGGGAIAGLVNLISKTPTNQPQVNFLLNGTTAKGIDASSFYSQKWKKVGTTVFTSYNYNGAYDPANVGFTAIPKTQRITFNPKLFLYLNEKTTGWFGVNTTYEDRFGGDLTVINGKGDAQHTFYERNKSGRASSQLSFSHQINKTSRLNLKNSIGFFDRKLSSSTSNFNAQQLSSFSEASYSTTFEKFESTTGVNFNTDNFKAKNAANLNYQIFTTGLFTQNTYKFSSRLSVEGGLRVDYNTAKVKAQSNSVFALPRVNVLFNISEHLTSRIGGGLGYKMPSPFSEEAEERGYSNIQPIVLANIKAEKSYGGNADLNYRSQIGEASLSINQLFFYTKLNHPLILQGTTFMNADGYLDTKGSETNVKIRWEDLHFFLGYTYTDAIQHFNGNAWQPLTSKNRLNSVIMLEASGKYRIGIEGLYVSKQKLTDGQIGKGYAMYGLLFEKMWEKLNLFVNAENFTDRRQTRWDNIYTGSIANPTFRDIYAPLDGVVVNAGINIKL